MPVLRLVFSRNIETIRIIRDESSSKPRSGSFLSSFFFSLAESHGDRLKKYVVAKWYLQTVEQRSEDETTSIARFKIQGSLQRAVPVGTLSLEADESGIAFSISGLPNALAMGEIYSCVINKGSGGVTAAGELRHDLPDICIR